MSLLAFATDYMDRSDYDDPELYWVRCALCDEPVNPDDQVTRHGEQVHDYCAALLCAEGDCEGHGDEEAKPRTGYWYKHFTSECPVCGRGDSWKERQYTPKPAQVAELLGWERLGSDPDTYTWHLFVSPDGETHDLGRGNVTLEALLAYCREREWVYEMTFDLGADLHRWRIWTNRSDWASVKYRHPDPLTALVRAVLAAAEQEKGND